MLSVNFVLGLKHVLFVSNTLSNITIPKINNNNINNKKIQPINAAAYNFPLKNCQIIVFSV